MLLGEDKPLTPNNLLTHPTKKRPAEEKTLLSQEKERPSKKRASPSLDAVSKELLKGESDQKEDRARDLAEFEPKAQEATILNEEILEDGTFVQIQKIESPKPKIQDAAKAPLTDLNNQSSGNQITTSVSLFPGKRKSPPTPPQDKAGLKSGKPPKKLKGLNESEIPTPPQSIDNLRSPTPPNMDRQNHIKLEGQEIIEKLTPPQALDLNEAAMSPNNFKERLKRLSLDTEKRMSLLSPNIQWTYSEVKDLSSDEIFNRWEPFDSQKKIVDFAYGSAFESWEPTDIRSTSGLLFDSSNELEHLKGEIFSKVAAVVALKEKRNSNRVSSAAAKEIADLEKELHESQENETQGDEKIDLLSLKEKLKSLKSSFEKEMSTLEKEILEGEKECASLREALLKKFTQYLLESTADFKSDIYYSARGQNYLLHKKALYLNSFNDFLICLKEHKKWALKSNQEETIFPLLKELQRQAKLCLLDFYKELPRYLSGHGIIKHGSSEFYKLLYKVLKKSVIFGEKEAENNNFQILKELQKLLEIVETIKCFEDGKLTKMKLFIREQFIKCYEE
ncbi:hypothetical protein CSEC_0062 [Criblamydia sequanensis CRIB-18]|uniref:Uncharacterized protein n=1 Tax=Candidatus Criblamydia sequanensis CRIB-18 TaxID=1437425 RepID=A0A090CXW0_9BACT|nr:hypothetical protein CSEC_0062 [Criblamydia sequanensis CRIB-18]